MVDFMQDEGVKSDTMTKVDDIHTLNYPDDDKTVKIQQKTMRCQKVKMGYFCWRNV